jgi:uncharacterized RDD family membrane protein YckC
MADAAAQAKPEYVGFWKRVFATLIDSLVMIAVVVPIALAVYGTQYLQLNAAGKTWAFDWLMNGLLVVAIIVLWRYRGATPGKMLVSAKIVDANTLGAPSTGKLIGRYFAYFVSTIPLCLGFLWIAFDKRKQGWHDKLAGTLVIRDEED